MDPPPSGPETQHDPRPNFRKDLESILLLFFLYILQGIPLGLIATVPFLLQSQGVAYKDQAVFSIAFWPFSLKVLYAPVVDAIYWRRLGRRKSWLIPLQYLISVFLFILAFQVDDLFSSKNVTALAAMFFMLNFLAASQDVAVDGWALTMLSPENVGYASTCNAVGQALGIVMGYSGFLALESARFANHFRTVPLDTGLVTLSQFLLFWAIVFGLTTTLVLLFKREKKECAEVTEQHMDILASYKNLWKILKLRNVQILILFYLTVKVGTAATDAITKLKLVEKGVPKETIAFFSIPLIPLKLLLPVLLAKWTVGPNPMRLYIAMVPLSLCFGVIYPLIVHWSPEFRSEVNGEYPFWYFACLFGVFALELVPNYARFVTGMGFSAKVSDPAVGGTYMTLINTIANVGATWPVSLALWLVDYVSVPIKDCPFEDQALQNGSHNAAGSTITTILDLNNGTGKPYSDLAYSVPGNGSRIGALDPPCVGEFDGYYVESIVFVAIGILWMFWGRPTILRLQEKKPATWRVVDVVKENPDTRL